ncbi:MAG TPA: undecaprenyl-phosphate glucose phosphotransferase [Vicinamibacterales bacterium]|nr:undecaprenyl-phosphate glucose phosphotransferase [Acidobacteriota bacterium]HOC17591.1 undecaprenyl-phosphate glucose phosphotransferase [Vicinamibacterales bacterium]
MVKRYNRLLAAVHVLSDAILASAAFMLAYLLRFEAGLVPVTKGYPPLSQYLRILPVVAILVPFGYHLQGLYRLRRGRSRVDDFFAVFVGTVLAVIFGIVATLYFQAYYASPALKEVGAFQVSQIVWAVFLVANIALTFGSREMMRQLLERRWRAGIGLKRVLIAGAGDLGRVVVDRILDHRELGFQIVGFVDDRAGGDHLGHRGLPLLGTLREVSEIVQRERVDHVYVTLPLEEHGKIVQVIEGAAREGVDVKVVPDLLEFIALRARLEDLDGVPIININDVPLQGLNSALKRAIDIGCSAAAMAVLAVPFALIALAVRLTSPGPVFYRQERMGLDGRAFTVYKFRSMFEDAERETGPIWAAEDDPRCTPVGRLLRRFDLDELPQIWNVLKGDMSLVGPRPERPYFVEQFKQRYPQYMLRHKVRAGITGWAQVNGWRGNTSIEKRIEYDLYYIGNWSLRLDFKIIWLTLVRGWIKPAY